MEVKLSSKDIQLQEIAKEYQDNFKCYEGNLSDFWAESLAIVGDMIMPKGCGGCFCSNNYWWDVKETEHRWSVFMTENGNLMLKDWDAEKMWRVSIRRNR